MKKSIIKLMPIGGQAENGKSMYCLEIDDNWFIIDAGYRGEIHINLFKVVRGKEDVRIRRRGFLGFLGFKEWAAVINPGEKIIQGIIHSISNEAAIQISNSAYEQGPKTKRQSGAFGSTGTK